MPVDVKVPDGVDVVDASEFEAQIARQHDQGIEADSAGPSGKHAPSRRDIVAEIQAVTNLLRAQHDRKQQHDGPQEGSITHAVMQERLKGLQAALAAVPENGSDEDDWSDSSADVDEEGPGPDHAAATKAPPSTNALVETERERQIRMGLITPFDNVTGAASAVRRDAAAPAPAPLLMPSSQSAKLARTAKRLARQQTKVEAARPAVKLMDPQELDEDMLQFVRKQEYFKQRTSGETAAAAAAAAKAVRYKRAQTLPRAPAGQRKRQRTTKGMLSSRDGQQAERKGCEGGSDGDSWLPSCSGSKRATSDDNAAPPATSSCHSADSDADSLSLEPASSSNSDSGESTGWDDCDDADSDCYVARTTRWREQRRHHGAPVPGSKAVRDAVLASAPASAQPSSDDEFDGREVPANTGREGAGNAGSSSAIAATAQEERMVQAVQAAVDAEEGADMALTRARRARAAVAAFDTQQVCSGRGASTSTPRPHRRSATRVAENSAMPADSVSPAPAAEPAGSDPSGGHGAVVRFDGGFQMPASTYDRLFPYQQVGVKWLWELHLQRAGGIMGDEMGLGKTVQLVAFLGGLAGSGLFKPSLILAPVTTLKHWQRELRAWHPEFRVIILHHTARSAYNRPRPTAHALIAKAASSPRGVLLTSYEQLRKHALPLLDVDWGYCVLDEGHRIRNPDADITLLCKQVKTVHRVIMTGTPIQNRLTELWSLFDCVFPGKLGTLPVFQSQFGVPIQAGTYANASAVAVAAAYKCAVMLRDMISPYLLRRSKADVAKQLPEKTEHVLFCSLSPPQRKLYKAYLGSKDVSEIFDGKRPAMEGITVLRKICNHADLLHRVELITNPEVDYGALERSAKLQVLAKWHEQGHKALLFTQTQQMLDIIERHVSEANLTYHRMDGSVALPQRFRMIDDFNTNPNVFLFLLTTRVGGLGVNLTGANRILLFDPDWNPATDIQARERAWRLGQKKPVTIFRLITRGAIEEKVYHRQIYKHALSTRILNDPRQKRYVASRDLRDLFSLTDQHHSGGSETASIFRGIGEQVTAADLRANGDEGASTEAETVTPAQDIVARKHASNEPETAQQSTADKRTRPGTPGGGDTEDTDDAGILRELFSGSGLHSALNHSAIEGSSDPAKLDAEQQAAKVAERAAAALKASRAAVRSEPVHIPTWTGRAGDSGAPQRFGNASRIGLAPPLRTGSPAGGASRPRGFATGGAAGAVPGRAAASAQIIAQHKKREAEAAAEAAGTSADAQVAGELMARVVSFLGSQAQHRATSARLLDEFARDAERNGGMLFKQALRQVATLMKGPAGAEWTLKKEFE